MINSKIKQKLDTSMNVIKSFERRITNFFNPVSGPEEESIITYVLEFKDEEEAEDWDGELENWEDDDDGPGNIEHYLNYRIVQIIPFISTDNDNEALADNKALLIQNAALESLSTLETRKAFMWLFEYISDGRK